MASFNPMVSWSPYYQYMSFEDNIQTIIFCPWLPKSHSSYIEDASLNSLDSNFHLITQTYILSPESHIRIKSGSIETGTPTSRENVEWKQACYFQCIMVCQA